MSAMLGHKKNTKKKQDGKKHTVIKFIMVLFAKYIAITTMSTNKHTQFY
jgi:hypothetical protein